MARFNFHDLLERLRIDERMLGELMNEQPGTVIAWINGSRRIPGAVLMMLESLVAVIDAETSLSAEGPTERRPIANMIADVAEGKMPADLVPHTIWAQVFTRAVDQKILARRGRFRRDLRRA